MSVTLSPPGLYVVIFIDAVIYHISLPTYCVHLVKIRWRCCRVVTVRGWGFTCFGRHRGFSGTV